MNRTKTINFSEKQIKLLTRALSMYNNFMLEHREFLRPNEKEGINELDDLVNVVKLVPWNEGR